MTTKLANRPEKGTSVPAISLLATDGQSYDLSALPGLTVVYGYPRTSPPNSAPIPGWDAIPGARGCTPQSCGFRDHFEALKDAGVSQVFGLSTQDNAYQAEVADRLHLPFPLLSDPTLALAQAMRLETFKAGGMTLLKRITMIIRDGALEHTLFPVPHPDQNAADVVAFLLRAAHRG